eukprot:scaffold198058_cov18-Tisochrysis_lutea.AAC.1
MDGITGPAAHGTEIGELHNAGCSACVTLMASTLDSPAAAALPPILPSLMHTWPDEAASLGSKWRPVEGFTKGARWTCPAGWWLGVRGVARPG